MKDELVEKVARAIYAEDWPEARHATFDETAEDMRVRYSGLARTAIAAIPQAGDTGALVERLEKKAKYTDATFSNSSLGQLYREAATTIRTLQARLDAVREALEPSGDTKAAYMGEFSFTEPYFDDEGEEHYRKIYVPWTTVKEIMAAIRERSGHD